MSQENADGFSMLVESIQGVHSQLVQQVSRAVNVSLTLRNWLIGYHIAEYELNGRDRAKYGDALLTRLASELKSLSNCNRRQLYRYLRLYNLYPQIVGTVPPQLRDLLPTSKQALAQAPPERDLLSLLSYSHLDLLVDIEDSAERNFYEAECIAGNWSVRELKRQIKSLYYGRTALSRNKQKLSNFSHKNADQQRKVLNIRDPYVFEFLGLQPTEVMHESDLEQALIDRLQDFLLELGHGFCFEARQRRILIGDEHFFVDLVFYHRILKCHILIELKVDAFSHEHLGQLNTYVSWYKQNVKEETDNPPIGLLLCTDKNHALVEYALAGIDNQLFVSKYQLILPSTEVIQQFLEQARMEERAPDKPK